MKILWQLLLISLVPVQAIEMKLDDIGKAFTPVIVDGS
jgi:hypothetical protein